MPQTLRQIIKELAFPRTGEDFLASAAFVVMIGLACFMPAQNDTWWQLASGLKIFESGRIQLTDQFSWTAHGAYWPNHEWLSQVVFYGAYRLGGLVLLQAIGVGLVAAALVLVWGQMSGTPLLKGLLLFFLLAGLVTEWSLRPKLFTFALTAVTIRVLSTNRLWWMPVLMFVWANLHGAFAVGLVLLAARCFEALIHERHRLVQLGLIFAASTLATAFTPLGFSLVSDVLLTLERPDVRQVQEWQPAGTSGWHWVFFVGAATVLVLVARFRKDLRPAERTLAYCCLFLTPLAVRYSRNIPLFMLAAVPLLSGLLYRVPFLVESLRNARPSGAKQTRRLCLVCLGVVLFVGTGWSRRVAILDWTPISRSMVTAVESCPSPIYNHFDLGGYLIWFVPTKPVFIDGRQLPYPQEFVLEHFEMERSGDYREVFGRFNIRCAVLPPTSPVLTRLLADGWHEQARDPRWVVVQQR